MKRRIETFEVDDSWGLGDRICALIALREYAKRLPSVQVLYREIPEITRLFSDRLVLPTLRRGRRFENWPLHRQRWFSPCWNYLGTYLAELGLDTPRPPEIRGLLPALPRPQRLPKRYAVILPYSTFARPNLPSVVIEEAVRVIRRGVLRGAPVFCTGRLTTPQDIEGVSYANLGGPLRMLALIQHADIVLTARSASCNIAPAYGVPAVVWAPSDGENWNMNYPTWRKAVVPIHDPEIVSHIVSAARSILESEEEREARIMRAHKTGSIE